VGVYNSESDVESIIAGFYGDKGSGGEYDNPTGYMAPTGKIALSWDEQYTYEYCLVMGNIDTVRNYVYKLHESELQHGRSNGLKKHFNIPIGTGAGLGVGVEGVVTTTTTTNTTTNATTTSTHEVPAPVVPHGIV